MAVPPAFPLSSPFPSPFTSVQSGHILLGQSSQRKMMSCPPWGRHVGKQKNVISSWGLSYFVVQGTVQSVIYLIIFTELKCELLPFYSPDLITVYGMVRCREEACCPWTTPPLSSWRSHPDVLLLVCVIDREGCCALGRRVQAHGGIWETWSSNTNASFTLCFLLTSRQWQCV